MFIKKLKGNNVGTIMYNRVICYFIMFIVLMFGIDMCLCFTQSLVTSYQSSYYAEKISVQGGLLGSSRVLPGCINSGGKWENDIIGGKCIAGVQKQCSSCFTNADISRTFGQTMEKFGLTSYDWNIALITDDSTIWVHNNGKTVNTSQRVRLDHMSVNDLYVSSRFVPKVSGFLWNGVLLEKQITFISEYIER